MSDLRALNLSALAELLAQLYGVLDGVAQQADGIAELIAAGESDTTPGADGFNPAATAMVAARMAAAEAQKVAAAMERVASLAWAETSEADLEKLRAAVRRTAEGAGGGGGAGGSGEVEDG
jgi:hypothetical protein